MKIPQLIRAYCLSVIAFLLALLLSSTAQAQAPNVSYPAGNKTYPVGTAISPLSPTNTGGAIQVGVIVSTLAGSGSAGFADGTSTEASSIFPNSVAVDGRGNMYIADQNNNRIRKVSASAGIISTVVTSGNIYIADNNHMLKMVQANRSFIIGCSHLTFC